MEGSKPRNCNTMNVYRCLNVSKTFEQGENTVHALQDINLEIDAGDFLWISGSSGSGKSTLLSLLGLLDIPTKGDIFFQDQNLSTFTERERDHFRKHHIGFVFQNFHLFPILTSYENVELALDLCGKKQPELIREILAQVGLEKEQHRYPSQLSGGQQQRVAIARAIIKKPMVILADEPTANLDSKNSMEILKLLKNIAIEKGHTVIVSSHEMMLQEFCNKEIHILDGQIQYCKAYPSNQTCPSPI